MLRNWLIVAIRSLLRHRLYTAINVLGLAAGLTAALLIALFVRHELSYDSQYPDAGCIWRLDRTELVAGRAPEPTASQSMPMGPAIAAHFPEVEQMVRVGRTREIVRRGADSLYQMVTAVDPAFFQLFPMPFLAGDPATALAQPNTAVLSRSLAEKLYGRTDILGRPLELAGGRVLTVTGVVLDPPSNTTLQPEFLTAIDTPVGQFAANRENWNSNFLNVYLLLKPGTDGAALDRAFPDFLRLVRPDQADAEQRGDGVALSLHALRDLHVRPLPGEDGTPLAVLAGLTALAGVILAIAAINFVNLATARATQRAREVALRKTLGASRGLIMIQFLGESLLLTLFAGLLSLALVELLLPPFLTALDMRMDPAFHTMGGMAAMAAGLVLLLGLAGGAYPALVLSGFRPAEVLRGNGRMVGGSRLRAVLVVLQFSVAIGLSVATLVVWEQTRFASTQRLGFDQENVVLLREVDNPGVAPRLEALKTRLRADPGVLSVAGAPWAPSDSSERTSTFVDPETGKDVTIRTEPVDFGYFETLRARVLAGRGFDEARSTDRLPQDVPGAAPVTGRAAATVLSRAAVRRLGWPDADAAIGRTLTYPSDGGDIALTVIGVVDDLQYKSARSATVPTIYLAAPEEAGTLLVRVAAGAVPGVLERIDGLWRTLMPDVPLRRHFLDDRIGQLYAADQRQARVFGGFAGLAVLIACLGLYGLAAFTAQRRTKEIGVRKVLGAGVPDIVRLLVWQFSQPVLVANLIAWPLAWIGLSQWLEGFAYRIDLNPALFLAAGAAALLIAWITVAGHAARVAAQKPVTALRYE
ncbi:ABC transporter permease [Oleisolibacter albus]|uniref:ABC transporter permease n=1 Tax=Oleisolibacter albus TaxID=2171757 RepID=UPI000DF4229D|nr:ABC transporter permease [Oleisolibacter albus]